MHLLNYMNNKYTENSMYIYLDLNAFNPIIPRMLNQIILMMP